MRIIHLWLSVFILLPALANAQSALMALQPDRIFSGEKLYESLLTKEEMARAVDMNGYFRVPADGRDLNYNRFFEEGEEVITESGEYHSHNTHRPNKEETNSRNEIYIS